LDRLAFEFGWLPSLEAQRLHRWHFDHLAWGIIDGNLGWRSNFNILWASADAMLFPLSHGLSSV
jgi:hypothetical protein